MLSNFIIRSTAAFGGTPFRLNKCTALGSAGSGAATGAAVGGVPGALVGGALGIASSLVSGLFGKHNTNKTNEMNYKIMQEQNRFNSAEAKKLRDWQEMMYRMYGTSSAKANDMRAAGLNALLGDVSASGVVGTGAAELAAAFGNEVRILDVNMNTMLAAKKTYPANITYMISNRSNLEKCLRESDVIINGILWAKDRKDHIVYREDLKLMKPGAMIVDVACDENGAIETCRDTTHDDPIYFVDGVMHYCVDNIPSAFSQTASVTLANATLPYLLQMADKGFKKAMEDNRLLRLGMTCYDGKLTLKETALKQNREWTDADELVKVW